MFCLLLSFEVFGCFWGSSGLLSSGFFVFAGSSGFFCWSLDGFVGSASFFWGFAGGWSGFFGSASLVLSCGVSCLVASVLGLFSAGFFGASSVFLGASSDFLGASSALLGPSTFLPSSACLGRSCLGLESSKVTFFCSLGLVTSPVDLGASTEGFLPSVTMTEEFLRFFSLTGLAEAGSILGLGSLRWTAAEFMFPKSLRLGFSSTMWNTCPTLLRPSGLNLYTSKSVDASATCPEDLLVGERRRREDDLSVRVEVGLLRGLVGWRLAMQVVVA